MPGGSYGNDPGEDVETGPGIPPGLLLPRRGSRGPRTSCNGAVDCEPLRTATSLLSQCGKPSLPTALSTAPRSEHPHTTTAACLVPYIHSNPTVFVHAFSNDIWAPSEKV